MLKIVFTNPYDVPGEKDKIINLLKGDLDFLHIRKPDYQLGEMIEFISRIPEEFHDKLILHSHYELIADYDLAGINFNKKAMELLVYENEISKGFIQPYVLTRFGIEILKIRPKLVTYAAHSFEEIENLPFKPDYVFLSPIFDSISKKDYVSTFSDLNKLKEGLSTCKQRVIALGGIDDTKRVLCASLGFSGFAMLGNVWRQDLTEIESKA